MIELFEAETQPLNDYEREKLLPVMVKCLKRHKGKEKAITNRNMCEGLQTHGYVDVNMVRVRKLINHIRTNWLVGCLMASSKGYYVADSKNELRKYLRSLDGRISAIMAVRQAIVEQLKTMEDDKDKEHSPQQ